MPFADFAKRRAVLVVEGRRLVCRPPAVATVYRFLELFGREVRGVAEAIFERGATWDGALEDELVPMFASSRRLADVLDTCVEMHGGAPGELVDLLAAREDLRVTVAEAVLELCDARRVLDSLNLRSLLTREKDLAPPDPARPPRLDLALCSAALRYQCSPLDVAQWPYEAFLSVDAVEGWLSSQVRRPTAEPAGTPGVNLLAPADELAAQGVMVRRLKKR